MIHSRPKPSTFFALGLIVLVQFFGLVYILNHFATERTFGVLIYLMATVILTLGIVLLMVKMMAAYKFIAIGNDQIITKLPLRGKTTKYALSEVLVWDEETVITNKREFKQITIVFEDRSSFTISNHEHINYEEFIKYFNKRLSKKKIPVRKNLKT